MNGRKKIIRRYSHELIKKYLVSYHASGMNRHRFAKINEINYFTFIGWLAKYKEVEPGNQRVGFTEVKLSNQAGLFAELRTENGKSIRFYQVPPPEYLKMVLSV
jgi:transposase